MDAVAAIIDREIERGRGILKLRPNYVCRYYKSGGRLRAGECADLAAGRKLSRWVPERWLASTVAALNPDLVPGEGLSLLDIPGKSISLKDALFVRGEQILGEILAARYGNDFPVLSKVLDPSEPIVFQFHPRDEDVIRFPEHFAPNRNGKEEAYYFLPGAKGSTPYTHLGFYPGVTKGDVTGAIERGTDYVLDLSPAVLQRFEEGFYVPAGMPHRPGTALTLEIQQPSDAFTHLDWYCGGKRLGPEQTHPGFNSIEEALAFLDWERSTDPHILEKSRIVPVRIPESHQPGNGEEAWIFPPTLSSKFSGKRVRVTGTFDMIEKSAYVLLIWQGQGKLDGRVVAAGDEFFVTFTASHAPHRLERAGSEVLEAFKLFPPGIG